MTRRQKLCWGGILILVIVASLVARHGLTQAPSEDEKAKWVTSYSKGQALARSLERPLMINFTAEWCVACQDLDVQVFRHPEIDARLDSEFVTVKIDVDERSEDTQQAIQRFEVSALPRVAFATADGEFLRRASFEGKVEIGEFERRLDQALEGSGSEPTDG